MTEEFNLKRSRYELVRQLREDFGIHNSKAWSIMKRVEEQDKEFIKKLLTPNNISKGFVEVSTIKYYAGDLK